MTWRVRVSKSEWYEAGGLRNSRCIRRQRNGVWFYYILCE